MKRILFYESRPEWGGAQKCELELLTALESDSVETYFVTSTMGPMNSRVNAAGKQVTVIPVHPNVDQIRKGQVKTGLFFLLVQVFYIVPHFWKVMAFIRKNQINLVYTSQFRSQLLIGWLAKLLGLKVVWHIHGEEQLNNLLGKISAASADKIIVVSQTLADRYKELFPKQKSKFVVVKNGVDDMTFAPKKELPVFTISTVGTIIEGKRQDLAIYAVAELAKKGHHVQLNIIGEKPPWHPDEYKNSLLELAAQLNLTNSVNFLGWVENPSDILHQSHVFILPSDTEGMPLSIIEAMALGLPCISTNVGGVPELIEDGKTGFLIKPGHAEELADKLMLLLEQRALCERMGQQARERYESQFTKNMFVKGVAGVVDTVSP
ncbi:glycosyltransferase family 4 protein [Neobacillus notoginsengisoli]|uniref:glycosyltransferase family 4 protein n=1 Tax=Neobacillus notoginsengisoli TaxID=1578198 RepID=UPI001314A9DF|nr:glycosyltransferase family 4 protein [Neobacillus notoginsengisoli]